MNSIFQRLALGAANFGRSYGLSGKHVDETEQKEILAFCKEVGIDMIDTATAYGWDWTSAKDFKFVVKVDVCDTVAVIDKVVSHCPYCLMAHLPQMLKYISDFVWQTSIKKGISVYCNEDLKNCEEIQVIQIPYSIFDRRWEKVIPELKEKGLEVHARSIFLQGAVFCDTIPEHLKPIEDKIRLIQGYDNPALACMLFVLLNRNIDRVIMGVDSLKQLENNVKFFRRLDDFEVKEENILNPRCWGRQ